MLGQSLLENLAVLVIVLQCAYLGYATKALKGSKIRLVDMGEMGVGDDDIGQGLDVSEAMGQSAADQQGFVRAKTPCYLVGSSSLQ